MVEESVLSNVRIAAPCGESWEKMTGTDQVRACAGCKMNVYNLSEMSEASAKELLETHEGRLCVRYYERADGTVMTKDCSVGVKRRRNRRMRLAAAIAAVFSILGLGARAQSRASNPGGPTLVEAIKSKCVEPGLDFLSHKLDLDGLCNCEPFAGMTMMLGELVGPPPVQTAVPVAPAIPDEEAPEGEFPESDVVL